MKIINFSKIILCFVLVFCISFSPSIGYSSKPMETINVQRKFSSNESAIAKDAGLTGIDDYQSLRGELPIEVRNQLELIQAVIDEESIEEIITLMPDCNLTDTKQFFKCVGYDLIKSSSNKTTINMKGKTAYLPEIVPNIFLVLLKISEDMYYKQNEIGKQTANNFAFILGFELVHQIKTNPSALYAVVMPKENECSATEALCILIKGIETIFVLISEGMEPILAIIIILISTVVSIGVCSEDPNYSCD